MKVLPLSAETLNSAPARPSASLPTPILVKSNLPSFLTTVVPSPVWSLLFFTVAVLVTWSTASEVTTPW